MNSPKIGDEYRSTDYEGHFVRGLLGIMKSDGVFVQTKPGKARRYTGKKNSQGQKIYEGDRNDSNRCIAITRSGTPCTKQVEPGTKYCFQHQPERVNQMESAARERAVEAEIKWRTEEIIKKQEWAKERDGYLKDVSTAWHELRSVRQKIEAERLKLDKLLIKSSSLRGYLGDTDGINGIKRLKEIYQVAKENKDAETMERVNKSIYYANRNLEKKYEICSHQVILK